MSTLDTMRAMLRTELRMNSPYVDAAIAEAIKYCRNEEYWFNAAKHTFLTVADQYQYELPSDYLSIRGEVFVRPNGSDGTRYIARHISLDELESYLFSLSEWDGYQSTGRTKVYAIDNASRKIHLGPTPSNSGDEVYFRYTKDLGTPTYTATTTSSSPPSLATVVTLTDPDGSTLSTGFTNEWFKEGFDLVRNRAMYYLWTRYHGGTEESQVKAQNYLMQFLEERMRIRGESADKTSPRLVRRYI